MNQKFESKKVIIPNEQGIETKGFLNLSSTLNGFVIFAHGSGSSRFSTRNQQVATSLNEIGIGTLLFDLLTEQESQNRTNVFDIPFLAKRLIAATKWVQRQDFAKNLSIGYFGASTGAGAALSAAADLKDQIFAVVSRGGRPDLAMQHLKDVTAPTLLLVGDRDYQVITYNEEARQELKNAKLTLIPGATHLFEEAGTLEQVSKLAGDWFINYLPKTKRLFNDLE